VAFLGTARLLLVPLTRRLMAQRLAYNDFRVPLGPAGEEIHLGPQWPGDPLPVFPVWIAALDDEDAVMPDTYVVVARETGEAVGMVGAKGGPDRAGTQEIGYGMNPDAQGRGYATEAVGALVADLLDRVSAVTAFTAVPNVASQRVLEKLGFVRTGTAWTEEDGDLVSWSLARSPSTVD
jgi:RimJ/RimL family protein N-acetyltransferase